MRDPDARQRIRDRFCEAAHRVATAMAAVGLDARVGEVPGEYCPGDFSVNHAGRIKIAGLGQRVVGGGAHVGGVIVVSGTALVRDVLVPVYESLGLDWEPATTGSVEDAAPGATWDAVAEALINECAQACSTTEADLPAELVQEAVEMLAPARQGVTP